MIVCTCCWCVSRLCYYHSLLLLVPTVGDEIEAPEAEEAEVTGQVKEKAEEKGQVEEEEEVVVLPKPVEATVKVQEEVKSRKSAVLVGVMEEEEEGAEGVLSSGGSGDWGEWGRTKWGKGPGIGRYQLY